MTAGRDRREHDADLRQAEIHQKDLQQQRRAPEERGVEGRDAEHHAVAGQPAKGGGKRQNGRGDHRGETDEERERRAHQKAVAQADAEKKVQAAEDVPVAQVEAVEEQKKQEQELDPGDQRLEREAQSGDRPDVGDQNEGYRERPRASEPTTPGNPVPSANQPLACDRSNGASAAAQTKNTSTHGAQGRSKRSLQMRCNAGSRLPDSDHCVLYWVRSAPYHFIDSSDRVPSSCIASTISASLAANSGSPLSIATDRGSRNSGSPTTLSG